MRYIQSALVVDGEEILVLLPNVEGVIAVREVQRNQVVALK
jgi:hypothetical protein